MARQHSTPIFSAFFSMIVAVIGGGALIWFYADDIAALMPRAEITSLIEEIDAVTVDDEPEPEPEPEPIPPEPEPEPTPEPAEEEIAETTESDATEDEEDELVEETNIPDELAKNPLVMAREKIRKSKDGVTVSAKTALSKLRGKVEQKLGAGGKRTALKKDNFSLWLARRKLLSATKDEEWNKIIATPQGLAMLNSLLNDQEWLEQFSGSGSMDNPAVSLRQLARLWANDPKKQLATSETARNLATAVAINGAKYSDGDNIELYRNYLKNYNAQLLHPSFDKLSTREMRFVVGYHQRSHLWEVNILARYHSVPRQNYSGLCWIPGYKLENFFGDSIHGSAYYAPWDHAYLPYEGVREVGGVCGSLSHYGSAMHRVHGLLSTPGGQPGHCAFLIRNPDTMRWYIDYSVDYGTGSHFSFWGRSSFPYMDLWEAMYKDRKSQIEADRLLWLAEREIQRQKTPVFEKNINDLFVEAQKVAPLHFGAYLEQSEWLKKIPPAGPLLKIWEQWGDRLAAGLKNYQIAVWDLINGQWLDLLAKHDPNRAFAYAKKYHGLLRQSDVPIAEQPNFNAILERQSALWKKDQSKNLELCKVVMAKQVGTPTYFSSVMQFGSDNLLNDEKYGKAFIKLIGEVARKAAAKDKNGGGIEKFLGSAIRAAAEAENIKTFKQLCDIYDRLSPPKKSDAKPKMAGILVSKDGALRTSSSAHESPHIYRRIIDETSGATNFHTGKEKEPWAMVLLPGPVMVSGIYIENLHTQNDGRSVPFVVWISEDGKKWDEVARETQVKGEYFIDLGKKAKKAKYVKVGRPADANKEDFFHLRKIQVFASKKYY